MIFEFLDASKRRIDTYNDNYMIEGVVRREVVDRLVKDSLSIEFDKELIRVVNESTYILLGNTGIFRVNPIFKITDIIYEDTVKVEGLSNTTGRMDDIKYDTIKGSNDSAIKIEMEDVAYGTIYEADPYMWEGEEETEQDGVEGKIRKEYIIVYSEGKEVSRVLVREEVTEEPVNEVVRYGTMVEVEEEEPIPYDKEERYEHYLLKGEEEVVQEGEEGLKLKTYNVGYDEEGKEVYKELKREKVIKRPINKVTKIGTSELVEEFEDIEYKTDYKYDKNLPPEEEHYYIEREGKKGIKKEVYRVSYKDFGGRDEKTYEYSEVVKEPVNEVEVRGAGRYVYEEEEIEYETEYKEDPDMWEDEEDVYIWGVNGKKEVKYMLIYDEEDEIIGREYVSEEVKEEPVTQVVYKGTKPVYYTEIEVVEEYVYHETNIPVYKEYMEEGEYISDVGREYAKDGRAKVTYEIEYEKDWVKNETIIDYEYIEEPVNTEFWYGLDPEYEYPDGTETKEYKTEIEYREERYESEYIKDGKEVEVVEGEVGYLISDMFLTYEDGYITDVLIADYIIDVIPSVNALIVEGTGDVNYETIIEEGEVEPSDEVVEDDWLPIGEERYEEGYPGKQLEIYKITDDEGNEIGKELLEEIVYEDPINNYRYIGTSETIIVDYIEEEEEDYYRVIYQENPDLEEGVENVIQEGKDGLILIKWKVYYDTEWEEVNEYVERVEETVIEERVDEIIEIGTKEVETLESIQQDIPVNEEPLAVRTMARADINRKPDLSGILSFIGQESSKLGYEIRLNTEMEESEIADRVVDLIGEEFTLKELIEGVLQVIDGTAEFDTKIEGDRVSKTVLHMKEILGKTHIDPLIEGVNLERFREKIRRDKIITAIEYTGKEVDEDTGELLTLKSLVGKRYSLPKTRRQAVVNKYTEINGEVRYILEDTSATNVYGESSADGSKALPIIKEKKNTRITNANDLVKEAIKELDGNNIPLTHYDIESTVRGVDVMDYVNIIHTERNEDLTMPVLSVVHELRNNKEVYMTVGDYMPTEIDRMFEELPSKTGGNGGGSNGYYKDEEGNTYDYYPGHYDSDGNWNTGGYYDSEGNFNEGFYDDKGHWSEGGDKGLVEYISRNIANTGVHRIPIAGTYKYWYQNTGGERPQWVGDVVDYMVERGPAENNTIGHLPETYAEGRILSVHFTNRAGSRIDPENLIFTVLDRDKKEDGDIGEA